MEKHLEPRLWLLLTVCFATDYLQAGPHEKRLLAYLFNRSRTDAHNPMERPASIDGSPVRVYLKCFLNQIMDVDEKNQILSTIIWLDMKWKDYHFRWDPNQYGGVKVINIPPERMWKPDIILYNSASEKFDQMFPVKVVVQHDGNIQWIPPGLFHSICIIEVDWFPFDTQYCHLKLGTWTYQGDTVDLKLQCENDSVVDRPCNIKTDVDLSTYLAHSEWALEINFIWFTMHCVARFFELVRRCNKRKNGEFVRRADTGAIVKRNMQKYGSEENETYIDLTMYAHIQRRALYYMFNIIVPCMIMSVMAMLVFTLPPEANEKIVLGVTTLLSLTMLLQLVADKLPQTSSGNPVLVVYFTCTIVLCSMSLVFAIVLLNCHHHSTGSDHVPWVIRVLVNNWLASILRIDVRSETEDNTSHPGYDGQGHHRRLLKTLRLSKVDHPKRWHGELINWATSSPAWSNMINMEMEFRPTLVTNHWRAYHADQQTNPLKMASQPTNGNDLRLGKTANYLPALGKERGYPVSITVANHISEGLQYSCTGENAQPANPLADYKETLRQSPLDSPTLDNGSMLSEQVDCSLSDDEQTDPTEERTHSFSEKTYIFKRIRELADEIRYITARLHRNDRQTRSTSQWKLASRVLDRLCLLIFAVINLFITLGVLTSAPTIIKAFTARGEPSKAM